MSAGDSRRPGLLFLVVLLGASGCWLHVRDSAPEPPLVYDEASFAGKRILTYRVRLRTEDGLPATTVIGRASLWRVRDGDTLLDIARYHDLGYNEIVEANPDVDPWLPPAGDTVVLPTAWVLPCCTYEGLVVNIPEMRLYFYRRAPDEPHTLLIRTHPVGLGREDRPTPRAKFRVWSKTENPRWIIPASIRRERIREDGDARTSIAGGDPENPLGKYRLALSLPRYAIHGTNRPWGVGRLVSHGCVRLYPEDIARLFPLVPVRTRGEFTYQPVKVGRRAGAVYVEVHPDIYGHMARLDRAAAAALRSSGVTVDPQALAAALEHSRGLPYRVTGPADS